MEDDGRVKFNHGVTIGVSDGRQRTVVPETDEDLAWVENEADSDHTVWHELRVVLCTGLVLAFLSYLAYLIVGK